jgi:pimeloyl-ACP methyl ester carboxylesterase
MTYSMFTPSHRGGSGSPLVCLHGFTDTWRTWELVLGELDGIGHCPQLDVPLEAAQLIVGFTAR